MSFTANTEFASAKVEPFIDGGGAPAGPSGPTTRSSSPSFARSSAWTGRTVAQRLQPRIRGDLPPSRRHQQHRPDRPLQAGLLRPGGQAGTSPSRRAGARRGACGRGSGSRQGTAVRGTARWAMAMERAGRRPRAMPRRCRRAGWPPFLIVVDVGHGSSCSPTSHRHRQDLHASSPTRQPSGSAGRPAPRGGARAAAQSGPTRMASTPRRAAPGHARDRRQLAQLASAWRRAATTPRRRAVPDALPVHDVRRGRAADPRRSFTGPAARSRDRDEPDNFQPHVAAALAGDGRRRLLASASGNRC